MPAGKHKSRTYRRVFVKTPGNRTVMHYRKRRPNKPQCSSCGGELQGVIRARPFEVKKTSKTKRRPERPYGGRLCSKCTRNLIKQKARQND